MRSARYIRRRKQSVIHSDDFTRDTASRPWNKEDENTMEEMRIEENTLALSHTNPEKKNKNEGEEDRIEYTCINPMQTPEEEEDDEEENKVQQ